MSNTLQFEVHQTRDGSYFLPEARVVGGSAEQGPSRADLPLENESKDWAAWGDGDTSPTEWRCSIEQVPIAMATIRKMVSIAYGNGLAYVKNEDIEKVAGGQMATVKRAYIPEVEQFRRENRIHRWLIAQLTDYHLTMNAFSELAWDMGKQKIRRIWHKEAEYCRIEKRDKSKLYSRHLYFSPYFADGKTPEKENRARIPLYNINISEERQTELQRFTNKTFAYHTLYPTPGLRYYARPLWIGLFRKGGWLEVAKNVPEIVSAMQRNQISIKYMIYIPEEYFKTRHPGWMTYTDIQRKEAIDKKVAELRDFVQKTENRGKSLAQVFKNDPGYNTGKPTGLDKITIEAIDDKTKSGTWVPDSNAADAQIIQSLGLHPSQMGLAPAGGKMGAGSGSDQRESYNTQITINTLDQDIILEPLNLIAEKNNWDITFVIDHVRHTTTNNKESGLEESSTGLEIT